MIPDNMKDWVLLYHNKGFSVIPLKERDKTPNIPSWSEYSKNRPTIEQIQIWLKDNLFQNIGIICGEISENLVVIDIDDKTIIDNLNISLQMIYNEGGLVVETTKGYHVYIKHKENPGDPTRDDKLHIEYRSNGNYVVAPPSIHPSGKQYSFMFIDENKPLELKIKDARKIFDNWTKELRERNGLETKTKTDISELKKGVQYGERNVSAFKLACNYKDSGLTIEETTKLMMDWNRKCNPPLHDRELLSCIKSAYKKPPQPKDDKLKPEMLKQYNVTSIDENTGKIKVNCPNLAKLLLYGDNEYYLILRDNQQILRFNGSYYEDKAEYRIENRINYYLDILTTNRIKSEVLGFIRSTEYINRDELNEKLNLINLKNGIYDMDTGELIPHQPDYHFLYEIQTGYNPEAKCPTWMKFLNDIAYPEDLPFLQEFCGFLLYRKYLWAILLILLGHGRNGKSTFINALQEVLGKINVSNVSLHILSYNRFAGAKLYHKHANLCADLGEQEIKQTGLIKELTGQDEIFAEEKHEVGFCFENYAKLLFACNLLPKINDNTLAMTERLAVVEFPNEFKRDTPECDPYLLEKLTTNEEKAGVLNWMLEGLRRLLKNKNFSKYRNFENLVEYQNIDPVRMFVDTLIIADPEGEILKEIIYKRYLEFCKLHDYPTLNDVWFSRKFKQFAPLGLEEGQPKAEGHKRTWRGIKFKNEADSTPTEVQQEALKC